MISYKVGKKNSTQLVKSTFQQAYSSRQPPADLIFHTDRGFNYTSKTIDDCLKALNVTHSFSRPYVPYDNSVMESFFSSMKREELYRTKYKSEKEFRDAVDKYIIFYNTKRPHKKLQSLKIRPFPQTRKAPKFRKLQAINSSVSSRRALFLLQYAHLRCYATKRNIKT